MSGKMYIPIIHELVCAFLDVSGAENRRTAIPSFTTGDVSIFRQALYKDGAAKITKDLRLHGLLPESVEFLSPSQAGYENGIGMMSAEERKAAGEKGYKNGLGSVEGGMAAEATKAAKYDAKWTAEVDESIKSMITDGVSFSEMASKLGNGLNKHHIYNRWYYRLMESSGITKPPVKPGPKSRITWTTDIDASIMRMRGENISYAKIASELGNGLNTNDIQSRWNRHLK
jgi:hypothetical protein